MSGRNDDWDAGKRREPNTMNVDEALSMLGAALNHVRAAGLAVVASNDDESGALVIRIKGAMKTEAAGVTAFVSRPARYSVGGEQERE